MKDELDHVRIDQWLWAVRIYKTRSEAKDACKSSSIKLNKKSIKPSSKVRLEDNIIVRKKGIIFEYIVKKIITKRVSSAKISEHIENKTLISQYTKIIQNKKNTMPSKNHLIKGRPTKKRRRSLEKFKKMGY